jgi:3-hydroxyisobutyrate dehydrogenase
LASKGAREVRSPTPLGSLTHEIYRLLVNSGEFSDKDFSVIYKYFSKKN